EVSDKMVCLACRCTFTNREDQMEHYKLDWHRFNLKQKLLGASPVSAEEFEKKTGAGDLSSISGSESDTEEGADSNHITGTENETLPESGEGSGRPCTKILFQNSAGQYLSVHRCILQGKSAQSDGEQDAGSSLKDINKKTSWVILMTGGGHFVGAVFQGKDVLQHKTFHRYTVRAKRGTAQGLRDSQNRSHAPKSAGAALRRYNEAALVKDIQDLLVSWSEHLQEASAVFIRAPSYNKGIFFGGRAAPLDKKDPRIRSIPFATRRATFREAQRVHEVLSTIHVYAKDTDVSAIFSPSKKVWKKTVKHAAQAKTDPDLGLVAAAEHQLTSEEEGDEIQLETLEVTLGTLDLRESEICPARHQRRRRRKKEQRKTQNDEVSKTKAGNAEEDILEATTGNGTEERPSKKGADDSVEYSLRDSLFTACKVGDIDSLHTLLQQSVSHPSAALGALLNEPVDSSGFTLLHVATAAAQKATVRLLMEAGADPACRDNKGRTPYIVAPDKDTRNVFRKYMGDNPDRYDYKKAQVPGALTVEMESKQLEKKKAQKLLRKQRDKEHKEELKKQELEVEEKKRFASLSDREKRALAAEKRLAKQVAATGVDIINVTRCWSCGESLLGKVPFQYSEYSFCTPRCVQAHRKANAAPGK
uniref:Ankyrin repeat and zinc finger peptidyl tRNA hydrolase 1 n=1 Tax=Tetraodon nigroviridis TaxID=99883 RepID=H3C4I3_TETNG